MYARISIIGTDILCEWDDARQNAAVRIPLTDKALTTLTAWAQRYQRAALSDDLSPFTELGATMLSWLNESRWMSNWMKGTEGQMLESRLPMPRALSSMRPGRFWPAGVTFSRRTRHRYSAFSGALAGGKRKARAADLPRSRDAIHSRLAGRGAGDQLRSRGGSYSRCGSAAAQTS